MLAVDYELAIRKDSKGKSVYVKGVLVLGLLIDNLNMVVLLKFIEGP